MRVKEESEKAGLKLNIPKTKLTASGPWGKIGNSGRLYFLRLQNHCKWWLQPWNEKTLAPWKESHDRPRQHVEKQRHHFAYKDPYSQSYGFFSSRVWMWELDHKEGWVQKNWCFQTVVLEKTLESPLNSKEIQPVNSKENQLWIFTRKADVEAEAQYFGYLIWRAASLERPWWWERLRARGKGGNRGWDGWMASVTQWTWVWADSGSWWRMGMPGMLLSIGHKGSDMT